MSGHGDACPRKDGQREDLETPIVTGRAAPTPQVFLLSPAYCAGRRAAMLLREGSEMPLARQLRADTLTLGAAFSFLSGLYFRGKLSYATTFGHLRDAPTDATLIITPTRGLERPELPLTAELLKEFASVDIDADNPRYRGALERDVAALSARLPENVRVILLGSIATGKYVDVLHPLLGRAAPLSAVLHWPRRHESRRVASTKRQFRRRAELHRRRGWQPPTGAPSAETGEVTLRLPFRSSRNSDAASGGCRR